MKKRKAKKPHEIIYISSFGSHTLADGDITTLIALDEYSEFLFAPVVSIQSNDLESAAENIRQLFLNISENYNARKHAQTTIYVTNFPENLHSLMKSAMRSEDSLVYHPAKTKQKVKPVIESFMNFKG